MPLTPPKTINIPGNAATATKLSTDSGAAPSYSCRAWVNFNGTGTVAIRASGNVSSITDHGVGEYTVNFTTAMPDVNYSTTVNARRTTNAISMTSIRGIGVYTATQVQIYTGDVAGAVIDTDIVCVMVFR